MRTVFETGKPHFVNHPMMVADHGERYAAVSCYNSLKIGGGAHTLVRLNLKEVALRHERLGSTSFLATTLPRYVELTAELMEARIRSLVEEQRFFDTHWLRTEGLIDIDRFSAMFGIFGLAECVNLLMAYEGRDRDGEARYGHDADADALAGYGRRAGRRAGRRPPDAVLRGRRRRAATCTARAASTSTSASPPAPASRSATSPACSSTSPRARRTTTCSPPASATSSTSTRPPSATRRRWSTSSAARSSAACATSRSTSTRNEFIRITGYLVRKSDLVDIAECGVVRHSSDQLAAGCENVVPPDPARGEAGRLP